MRPPLSPVGLRKVGNTRALQAAAPEEALASRRSPPAQRPHHEHGDRHGHPRRARRLCGRPNRKAVIWVAGVEKLTGWQRSWLWPRASFGSTAGLGMPQS